ncbi:MAG: rRNA maturation RNase YbeY [Desulfamplus sp.]
MAKQKILIQIQQKTVKISKEQTINKIDQILKALGYDKHEISVVITDNAHIRELNHLYRGIDAPTNVLSFSMLEGEFGSIGNLLGDLVVSAERAEEEAREFSITTDERMSQLLIHGILHLIGYDHDDQSEDDEFVSENFREMERKSLEILSLIEPNKNLDFF